MGRWHWGSPGVMISHRCFPVVGRFLRAFANCARAQWEHVPPPRTPTCNIMQQFQILIHSGVFVTLQIIFLLGPSRCLYRLTKLFRHIQLSDLCPAWVEYLHITCKIYRDIYIYIYIYMRHGTNSYSGQLLKLPFRKIFREALLFLPGTFRDCRVFDLSTTFEFSKAKLTFPFSAMQMLHLPSTIHIEPTMVSCHIPFQEQMSNTFPTTMACRQTHFQQQWSLVKCTSNNNGLLLNTCPAAMAPSQLHLQPSEHITYGPLGCLIRSELENL